MSNSTQSAELKKLKEKINNMDHLSQEGFSKIKGIANIAVKALNHSRKSDDELNAFTKRLTINP